MRYDLTAMDGWWPTCASQFQLHGDPFLVFETTWKQERTLASGQQIKVLVISGPPNPSPFNREIREIDGNRSSLVPKRLYHKHDQNHSKHNFSSLKPKTSSSRFTGQVHRFSAMHLFFLVWFVCWLWQPPCHRRARVSRTFKGLLLRTRIGWPIRSTPSFRPCVRWANLKLERLKPWLCNHNHSAIWCET